MLGLDNDGDVTTAVFPDLDDHDAMQQLTELWLPDGAVALRLHGLRIPASGRLENLSPGSCPHLPL